MPPPLQVALAKCLLVVWCACAAGQWLHERRARQAVALPDGPGLRVDINHATWQELTQLPRVGETMARRMVADREQSGPFRSIDDLTRVAGIGPVTAEQLGRYWWPLPRPAQTPAGTSGAAASRAPP